MSTPVKEQYIIDREGNKTGIILSIEQYEQMLEDLHDLAIVAERRSEKPVSLAKMQEWLKEDGSYRIYNPQTQIVKISSC